MASRMQLQALAPQLAFLSFQPTTHKSLFSVPHPHSRNILSGDTAMSKRLAAAPAHGPGTGVFWKQQQHRAGRWLGQQRDPSSANPVTGCLGGCSHSQRRVWQLFPSTALNMKDTDPHVTALLGCLSTADPPRPFGQEPVRS